jgi:hypothetical protein
VGLSLFFSHRYDDAITRWWWAKCNVPLTCRSWQASCTNYLLPLLLKKKFFFFLFQRVYLREKQRTDTHKKINANHYKLIFLFSRGKK